MYLEKEMGYYRYLERRRERRGETEIEREREREKGQRVTGDVDR